MTSLRTTLAASLAAASLGLLAAAQDAAAASRIRYQCAAQGATDISMSARYEVSTGATAQRRKFSTEFEAAPTLGFAAGHRLSVHVKGVRVGVMTLEALVGGDMVGDLNFDTRPQLDALPFPASWPAGVGRGTAVKLMRGTTTVLGCTLR